MLLGYAVARRLGDSATRRVERNEPICNAAVRWRSAGRVIVRRDVPIKFRPPYMPHFERLAVRRLARANRALSSRDRRAVRTGLVAVVPAVFYAFVVKPYISSVRQTIDALRSQSVLLDREEAVTRGQTVIRQRTNAAAAVARRVAPRLYAAADSALAMSAFGRDVTTALSDAGLVVQRLEVRDSLPRNAALRELTIDLRAQGDFEAVLGALTRLERNARLIHVSRVAVDKNGERRSTGAESLSLVAVIHGYSQ